MYFIAYTEDYTTRSKVVTFLTSKSDSERNYSSLMPQVSFADYLGWVSVAEKQKNMSIRQHIERWLESKHNVLHS